MIEMKFFVSCLVCLLVSSGKAQDFLPKDCEEYQSLRVVNWNIMAPVWVNEYAFHPAIIDRRLLNDTTRLEAVIKTLKQSDGDVLLLQEVQYDWLTRIQRELSPEYALAIYGRHIFNYWLSHKPRHRQFMANGGAIFFRSSKLIRVDARSLRTTSSGNVVTIATFALRSNGRASNLPRVILVNGQLERGILGFSTRTAQIRTIQATLLQLKRRLQTRKSPQIIWSGDFNTFTVFPGYAQVIKFGYENVFDSLGVVNPPNYFRSIGSPHATSYTFVENNGIINAHIQVIDSFFDPTADLRSPQAILDDRKEAIANYVGYIEQTTNYNETQIVELFGSFLLQLKYNNRLNVALRKGSDHTYQRSLFCLY